MADTTPPGSLLVGEGVFMKGKMQVPGVASIDGKAEGDLSADTVIVQANGSMNGRTTANHVRVAGSLTDTTVAKTTLVVEASGVIAGSITYTDLEIKKGGSLQGSIYKIGQEPAAVSQRSAAQRSTPESEFVAAPQATQATGNEQRSKPNQAGQRQYQALGQQGGFGKQGKGS